MTDEERRRIRAALDLCEPLRLTRRFVITDPDGPVIVEAETPERACWNAECCNGDAWWIDGDAVCVWGNGYTDRYTRAEALKEAPGEVLALLGLAE